MNGPRRRPAFPGFQEMAARCEEDERDGTDRLARQQLAATLSAKRAALGLSQTEVAARMGTSQSAVARLESGDADLRASTLERYAAALGTEITWTVQG